eukprot:CAMPEP_0168346330 /NCGR_PEP_ID=MMETSP0213-20121227/18186_1 /TAXON_ID=151035 /ORGANISM="Euplotes harpa, Strain FSP1.4" /LENGTH=179 /DNA_ID=CAMNT_0008354919 /DNA_START=55 /DNA_END=591 /DNA_ORIENTATION=-
MVFDFIQINYKNREINVAFGEQKKPWYLKINPNGAIPAIKEVDGFTTNEGIAIARYAILSREIDTPLYPYKDNKKTALINQGLEVVIEEYRSKVISAATAIFFQPAFFGAPKPDANHEKFLLDRLEAGLEKLKAMIIRNKGDYLLGQELSLVDLYAMVFTIVVVELQILSLSSHKIIEK